MIQNKHYMDNVQNDGYIVNMYVYVHVYRLRRLLFYWYQFNILVFWKYYKLSCPQNVFIVDKAFQVELVDSVFV